MKYHRFVYPFALAATFIVAPHLIADDLAAENKTPTEAGDAAKPDEGKDEKTEKSTNDTDDADASAKKAADKEKADEKTDATDKKADADKSKEASAKPAEKPAKPEEKRKTLKIEPKRLRIDLELEGTFAAEKTSEVAFRPEVWSDYEIVDVVEHGAKVHKGQVLFKFDSKTINDAIADMELDQRLSDLAIARAEEELPRMEKSLKMDAEEADRAERDAKEDFKRYQEIDRPMTVKTAKFMLKFYGFNLDYEKDELEQLEKMYKADDLTEATEEIVLKRQQNAVESAEFSLENAKLRSEEMLDISLPRMDIAIKESLEKAALAKARAQMALSLDLTRGRYTLEQAKKARIKARDKYTKLLADRELMEIKAPADGIVYYGQAVNGRWAETPSLLTKYKPRNNVAGGSILVTIVEERPLYITSTLEEGKRPDVSVGQKAKVALPAEGEDRIPGKVKSISPIPVSSGKFEIDFDVDQEELPKWIVAGMGCKVNITTYDKAEAVVVPKKAVHDDENDPDTHYVWLVDTDDAEAKPTRRDVKLGKTKEENVEITKGLKKGAVISLDDEAAKEKKEE